MMLLLVLLMGRKVIRSSDVVVLCKSDLTDSLLQMSFVFPV